MYDWKLENLKRHQKKGSGKRFVLDAGAGL
jgi:hypothetical protein